MNEGPKKRIYLVEASPAYGNAYFLPYATGAIAAYAFSHEAIKKAYLLGRIIYTREDIDSAVDSLDNPYLVGFSTSGWNEQYNRAFASKLKEKYPSCLVLFGGHSVPADASVINEEKYVDLLIHGEGEEPFYCLLSALDEGKPLSDIKNISYRGADGKGVTNEIVPSFRTDYPSPYLGGYFDDIVREGGGKIFQSVIETTRGCPYRCSYCDWDPQKTHARMFPIEKVKAEVDWSAENNISFMLFADSNLGIYERDLEIVDYVIDVYKKTGYPRRFQSCFAKDNDERVYEMNRRLSEAGISRSATISFQSMSPAVLENIGRKNMTAARFKELMSMYNALDIPTYSELILGLPGETFDSFREGISELLEAGQHATLFVHNCDLLPNSIMDSLEYRERFGIKTVVSPINKYHCEVTDDGVGERSNTVIGSFSMDISDWIKTSLYADCVQCFHCLGLLRCFAIYLRHEKNIGYSEFYTALFDYIMKSPETVAGRAYKKTDGILQKFVRGEGTATYFNPDFGTVIWRHEEGSFLEIISRCEAFYKEIKDFLLSFGIDENIYDDIMRYQKGILRLPERRESIIKFSYDWHGYFSGIYVNRYAPPRKVSCTLRAEDTNPVENWSDYAREAVWYGRKKGGTFMKKVNIEYNE